MIISIFVIWFVFVRNADGFEKNDTDSILAREKNFRVPVIDLAPWLQAREALPRMDESWNSSAEQQAIVNRVQKACKEVGFFQVEGHSVDSKIVENAMKASKDFFAQPLKEKLNHKSSNANEYPYGYERSERLAMGRFVENGQECKEEENQKVCHGQHQEDLKETYSIGPPDDNGSGMPPRRWLTGTPKDFQQSLEAYYEAMENLANTLLQIMALALEESPTFFDDKMDHHMSALRLVHYHPVAPSNEKDPKHHSKIIRAGAHTDYGALTILAAQTEGLEVLLPNANVDHDCSNRNHFENDDSVDKKQWHPVPVLPGAFVVNLGDLLQRWTNNEWVSTMHRVAAMPATTAREERYSMAYFVNVNGDTRIKPLGGHHDESLPVITAKEHLFAKHMASIGNTIGIAQEIEIEL